MDRSRRRFFGALVGGAAAATPIAVEAAAPLPRALQLASPVCPKCCNVQRIPSPHEFPSHAEWEQALTTPTEITCGNNNCRTRMTITFAR